MPRKRFTNEVIGFTLRQLENGVTVGEVCRKTIDNAYVMASNGRPRVECTNAP